MSQTLTKPILLDETGQAIAGKLDTNSAAIVDALDDIKEAIGNSEFIPLMLRVTTPPTKTAYLVGETLDLTGMVVSLIASNGAQIDVTSACTFVPANGATLTAANTSVAISYYYSPDAHTFTASQAIGVRELSSITVSTPPTKTTYKAGETLDLTGINVLAVYDDGYVESVTQNCVFSPANGATLSTSDSSVSISYTLNSVTKTTSQAILVKELSSIAVTTPPTEIEYTIGDQLDLTGIVVTATYSDGSTEEVTNSCTFSPADGSTLSLSDTAVTVSYTDAGITKTTSQVIDVTAPIYGAEWDGSATSAWTRTDLAAEFTEPTIINNPFDSIMPWSGMQEKTVAFGSQTGYFVEIPKFYFKWTRDGAKMKLQISMYPLTGFHVSPAHADRGDGVGERDYVYVGKYHSSTLGIPRGDAVGLSTNTSYTQRGWARQFYDNLRTSYPTIPIYMWDYAMWWTINMLYLVEYADWDCQTKIGMGCSLYGDASNYKTVESGYSITGHTGQDQMTIYNTVMYRYIVDLWANLNTYIDGIRMDQKNVYIIKNPSEFSDTTGGTLVTDNAPWTGTDYIKSWSDPESIEGYEYALFPLTSKGTEGYVKDATNIYPNDSNRQAVATEFGNYENNGTYRNRAGLFALKNQSKDNQSTSSSEKIGTRAMILPPSRLS